MRKPFALSALILGILSLLSLPGSSHQQAAFTNPSYTPHVYVYENATAGTVLTTITDSDPHSQGRIVRVVYQGPDQAFYTTPVSGQPKWHVVLNRTLDREAQVLLVVALQAQGQQNVESTDISFKLHVRDVNDNAPQFVNLPYNAEIDEDAAAGTSVSINIDATDSDTSAGGAVRYLLQTVSQGSSTGGGSTFIMDYDTGHVTLNGSLDYEVKTFYHYRVVAKDMGTPSLSSTTDLFINVKDVQDLPPMFLNTPYVASVNENSRLGSSVLTVRAIDQDRAIPNDVSYNITDAGQCQGLFQVESASGTISIASALDRDSSPLKDINGRCTIHIQATERAGPNPQKGLFTALTTATISVHDVNDNAPHFSHHSLSAHLSENAPVGTLLQLDPGQSIIVTDIDQGSNSAVQLSLVSGGQSFELTTPTIQSSGAVQLRVRNNTQLNYETHRSLDVQITASDGAHAATATVTVTIVNRIDSFSLEFAREEYIASVPEGSVPSTSVITVTATEKDSGDFGAIRYKLKNGRGIFTINNITGEVTVASAHTDRERQDRYYMMVVAIDGGGLQQTVPLTITLDDVNDNPPVFLRNQYDVTLNENSLVLKSDVVVQATDADKPGTANANVTYHISRTRPADLNSHFSVDAVRGNLSLLHPLDYDVLHFPQQTPGVVQVEVVASDHGTPSRLSSTATVLITLNDVNDHVPVFTSVNYHANVTESLGPGVQVGQVWATDGDMSATNNQVFYVIASGGSDQFRINSTSGVISTMTSLDRECQPDYNLTVLAMDRGSPAFTATTTVSVIVNNINDDPPRFLNPQITVTFPETRRPGVTITFCRATDGDDDAHLVYSVLWSQSTGLDDHQQNVSVAVLQRNFMLLVGRLTTGVRGLDREQMESATLYIQVVDTNADPSTTQTGTGTVMIRVEDVDDNPPVFSAHSFSANITENSPPGTPLQFSTAVTVTDVDKDENSVFVLSLSNFSDCLQVLPSRARAEATVLVRVTDSKCFDYESHTALDFKVIAEGTGNGNFTTQAPVHLTVININDVAPNFTAPFYTASIAENQNVSYSVITVHADDTDSPPFNLITYSLQGGDGRFSINKHTGAVMVASGELDYETRQQYQLTVEARDSGGLRDSVPLTITLTDLNDNTPRFVRPEYRAFAVEGDRNFTQDVTVQAVDGDGTEMNRGVHYRLSPLSQWSSNFSVNATTGLLMLTSPLDYEALNETDHGTIHLIVLATDQGIPQNTGSVDVFVTVQKVNEAKMCSCVNGHNNVTENQGVVNGHNVTEIQEVVNSHNVTEIQEVVNSHNNVTENHGMVNGHGNVNEHNGPGWCHQCRDLQCFTGPLTVACTEDKPLCASRVTDTDSGERHVEKGCISLAHCQAWVQADPEACHLVDLLVTGGALQCLFCCHGDLCNKGPNLIPARETLVSHTP